jgi:hypothetical protein
MQDGYVEKTRFGVLECNIIKICRLGTCSNLKISNYSMICEMQQMAFYVFKKLGGINYTYYSAAHALKLTGNHVVWKNEEMVKRYSSAPNVQQAVQIRELQ